MGHPLHNNDLQRSIARSEPSTITSNIRITRANVLERLDEDEGITRNRVGPTNEQAARMSLEHFFPIGSMTFLNGQNYSSSPFYGASSRQVIGPASGDRHGFPASNFDSGEEGLRPTALNTSLADVVAQALASARAVPHMDIINNGFRRLPPFSISDEKDSSVLRSVVSRAERALNEAKDSLVQFRNVISHMPDISVLERNAVPLLVESVTTALTFMDRVPVSEEGWKTEWEVIFTSIREMSASVMKCAECCVCMETQPVIQVCRSTEPPHLLCSKCLLSHYWVSTDECSKQNAFCPLCREPIHIVEIVDRLANITHESTCDESAS